MKRLETVFLPLLALFIFGLAASGKPLALMHIKIGNLPLYISEIFLFLSVLILVVPRFKDWCTGPLSPVITFTLLFIFVGLLRLIWKLPTQIHDFGLLRVLKDSALFYQSVWIFVGLALPPQRFKTFLSLLLVAIVITQLTEWTRFILGGFPFVQGKPLFNILGRVYGNEMIGSISPLVISVWSPLATTLYTICFGFFWFGQVTVYMKRTWFFTSFFIYLPAALIAARREKQALKKLLSWFVGLIAGLALAYASLSMNLNRANLDKDQFFTKEPHQILNHGETDIHAHPLSPKSFMQWRYFMWVRAWADFKLKPVFGHGFGPRVVKAVQWGDVSDESGNWISGPHNSYLTVLFRMGLLGFLPIFALSLFVTFRWMQNRSKQKWADVSFSLFVSASVSALFTICLENPHSGIFFWLFLGIALRHTKPVTASTPQPAPQA